MCCVSLSDKNRDQDISLRNICIRVIPLSSEGLLSEVKPCQSIFDYNAYHCFKFLVFMKKCLTPVSFLSTHYHAVLCGPFCSMITILLRCCSAVVVFQFLRADIVLPPRKHFRCLIAHLAPGGGYTVRNPVHQYHKLYACHFHSSPWCPYQRHICLISWQRRFGPLLLPSCMIDFAHAYRPIDAVPWSTGRTR